MFGGKRGVNAETNVMPIAQQSIRNRFSLPMLHDSATGATYNLTISLKSLNEKWLKVFHDHLFKSYRLIHLTNSNFNLYIHAHYQSFGNPLLMFFYWKMKPCSNRVVSKISMFQWFKKVVNNRLHILHGDNTLQLQGLLSSDFRYRNSP